MTDHNPAPDPAAIADVLRARLRLYREFLDGLDCVDHPTPLDFAYAYAKGRTQLQDGLRELAVVPSPAEFRAPTSEPTDATQPDPDRAPPTVPASALFTPPFQRGVLQLPLVVHVDTNSLWAEITGMPGLFATGTRPSELGTSLGEAVEAYLTESVATQLDNDDPPPAEPA